MKTKLKLLAMLTASALFGAAQAAGQSGGADSTGAQSSGAMSAGSSADSKSSTSGAGDASPAQRSEFRDLRASKIIGKDVRNTQGENLGEVKDVIVDMDSGKARHVVMEFGGTLGFGEKLFAYPTHVFRQSADGEQLVLAVDRDKLANAPGFARDRWPDWLQFGRQVDEYFGQQTAGADQGQLKRASQLIGMDVKDRQGKNAGEIEDVVINMGNGRLHYVVLDFDKAWSMNDKLLPLPPQALSFAPDRSEPILNVSRDRLDFARGFDEGSWPNVGDRQYMADVDHYLITVTPVAAAPDAQRSSGSSEQSSQSAGAGESSSGGSGSSSQAGTDEPTQRRASDGAAAGDRPANYQDSSSQSRGWSGVSPEGEAAQGTRGASAANR